MAKKKKASAPPSTTVELRLPEALYDLVQDVKRSHPEVIEETLRLMFHRDNIYGMTAVKLTLASKEGARAKASKSEESEEEIFKLCEG